MKVVTFPVLVGPQLMGATRKPSTKADSRSKRHIAQGMNRIDG